MAKAKLAALLLGALLAGLFAASCSGVPEITSKPEQTQEQLEPYDIVWYLGGPAQPDGEAVYALFNEKVGQRLPNTTVEIRIVEWANYTETMRIAMASQEKWDMCFTADWTNHFEAGVSRGAYVPIPWEMLETHGQGILNVMPADVWDCVTIDGQIMGISTWQIHCMTRALAIRKDLYEKYRTVFDFDAVRCKADFEPFFEMILVNEPGVTCFLSEVNSFGTAFDYNTGITFDPLMQGLVVRYDDPTFTIQDYLEQPEVLDFFVLMRKWYLRGFFASDASIVGDWMGEQRSGNYAAFEVGNAKPDNAAEFSSFAYPIVEVQFTGTSQGTKDLRHGIFGYSRTTKNLERCIMLTNLMYEDAELYRLMNHGVEDKHYYIREDGTLDTLNNNYNPGIDWELGNNALAYPRVGQGLDVYDRTRERNENAIRSPLFGFSFDSTPVKNQVIQVRSIFAEAYPILGTGSVDPETYIEELKQELEQAGFSEVRREMQRQVNAWLEQGENRAKAEAAVQSWLDGNNGKM